MTTTQMDTTLLDRVWKEAFDNGQFEVIDEAVAPDLEVETPGSAEPIRGAEGFKEYVGMLRTAFPDLSTTIEDRIVGDGAVVERYTLHGTHQGEFMEIPATGAEIELSGTVIHYVSDGRVTESVSEFDALDLMQQLGVVDVPRV